LTQAVCAFIYEQIDAKPGMSYAFVDSNWSPEMKVEDSLERCIDNTVGE